MRGVFQSLFLVAVTAFTLAVGSGFAAEANAACGRRPVRSFIARVARISARAASAPARLARNRCGSRRAGCGAGSCSR